MSKNFTEKCYRRFFTSIFLKEWKYGDGKKNRVRDYCRFWLYYTQHMKKSRFSKSVCVCVCVCVCLSVYLSVDFFSMANDKSHKFKQNQKIICIQLWIREFSRPIVFCEDRLTERGSLPAAFFYKGYFLWQTITAANSNRIK